MASDCKSDDLRSTGVQIPPCPLEVAGVAQWLEHLPSKQVRVGSTPITRSMDVATEKRCPRCQATKPVSEFPVRARGSPDSFCRACAKAYFHEYYLKNKALYVARAARHSKKMQEVLRVGKDKPCADCGRKYPYYVMDYDHRDGETKLCNVSALHARRRVSMRTLLAEIAKCDVVCANCHRERTQRRALLRKREATQVEGLLSWEE